MSPREITPKLLDTILNGLEVYIYRRPNDGEVYASIHDYRRVSNVQPVATVRVKVQRDSTLEGVLSDPAVLKAVQRARNEPPKGCEP